MFISKSIAAVFTENVVWITTENVCLSLVLGDYVKKAIA